MDKAGDVRLLVIEFQNGIISKHINANINYTYSHAGQFPKYIKKQYAINMPSLWMLCTCWQIPSDYLLSL